MTALVVAMIGCTACAEQPRSPQFVMSERFETCVRLPPDARYERVVKGIDHDVGKITVGTRELKVLIGQSVSLDRKATWKLPGITKDFILLVDRKAAGKREILFGQKRYERRGPLFVLLQGNPEDFAPIEQSLRSDGWLSYCEVPPQVGGDNARWREGHAP